MNNTEELAKENFKQNIDNQIDHTSDNETLLSRVASDIDALIKSKNGTVISGNSDNSIQIFYNSTINGDVSNSSLGIKEEKRESIGSENELFYDFCHVYEKGNRIIAQKILPYVLEAIKIKEQNKEK